MPGWPADRRLEMTKHTPTLDECHKAEEFAREQADEHAREQAEKFAREQAQQAYEDAYAAAYSEAFKEAYGPAYYDALADIVSSPMRGAPTMTLTTPCKR
jgi:flagellar biosynthesis/type III secretory pathway protein FliH